ncbi:MAG: hypothetical protein A3A08_02765 [Candidatus Nealsonbacteria bacterium RIFCSPLOWO2_01_FULL_41_9]|uniref:Uncharacterized protein n=1 Tax=Candidatus Nealsonbacteria bacterium RIFCSPLOWO2_01_FULL_41_9 TaxID=1801671 RepID=A0A1G2EER6_9BACT|nr:MAG: hypothetical protein A3A08_02765 [Candidatus Nealsonbacteria bacterium RIFCSPLOWO2_01_FULL_41_9]
MILQDQKIALDFLWYEMWMFNESFFQPNYVYVPSSRCGVENNALLESFLLHARNLIYFFKSGNLEDIRAVDFIGKNNSKLIYEQIKAGLSSQNSVDYIHKYLAHLTLQRIREKKPQWDKGRMREVINKGLNNFLDQVPEGELFPTEAKRNKADFKLLL